MNANPETGETQELQFSHDNCIKYAKSPLMEMGSEKRGINEEGWDGEQSTGKRHAIAFSLMPIEVEFAGEQTVVLAPPTVAFTKPESGYTRTPQDSRGQRTIFLALDSQTANDVCAMRDQSALDRSDPFPARFGPCPAAALALAVQLERLVFNKDHFSEALLFEEYAMQIVEHVLDATFKTCRTRLKPTTEKRMHRAAVNRVVVSICNNPERKWSLGELARSVDLSPAYLSRIFRRTSGRTLSQSLQLVRVVHAMEQLPDRDGDLTALALDCGFASHSHMTTAFNRVLGVSPRQFVNRSHPSIRNSIRCINKHLEQLGG